MQSNTDLLAHLPLDSRLAGRRAVVTGSTSGIGAAVAQVLVAAGASVAVSGRDRDRTAAAADAISRATTGSAGTATPVAVDLAGPADGVRGFAVRCATALGGPVDVLVNNAGIYPVGATEELGDEDLDAMLAVNVRAPHLLVAALAPAMVDLGTGAIVNIGSWMARVGSPYGAMYTATKAALEQLTRAWSAEYGPRGVRVNTVAPGATLTPGNASAEAILDAMTSTTTAGRPVRPIDIAYAVRFLVSDEAAFVHGTSLDVDGGILSARLG